MTPNALKGTAIACFVACAVCLYVAYERYQDNAASVNAIRQIADSSPLGDLLGTRRLEPATPAATKYALFFAVFAAAGGAASLYELRSKRAAAVDAGQKPPAPPYLPSA